MNDRFKFRAYHTPTKKLFYVYGFNPVFTFEDTLDGCGTNDINPAVTEDCILEQCTGLKDKNGNLIYEGDIISDFKYGVNCVVKFGVLNFKKVSEYDGSIRDVTCECFYFTELETGKVLNVFRQSHNIPENDWKIIGNIHEIRKLIFVEEKND